MWSWKYSSYLWQSILYATAGYYTFQWVRYEWSKSIAPVIDKKKVEVVLSPEELYKQKAKTTFLQHLFSKENAQQYKADSIYNERIDNVFYFKQNYLDTISKANNELEASWKMRILMEATPRGNVIMFYDAYKRGFAYYSDQTCTYDLLNAVAMKYVSTYRCRDFFLDELIVPADCKSPFIELYEKDDAPKKGAQDKTKIDVKKGPFAKLKSGYSSAATVGSPLSKSIPVRDPTPFLLNATTSTRELGSSKRADDAMIVKNRFISLGKIANFSMLSKPPKHVSKPVMDMPSATYGDFKFWKSAKQLDDPLFF